MILPQTKIHNGPSEKEEEVTGVIAQKDGISKHLFRRTN